MEDLLPATPLRKGHPNKSVLFHDAVASSPLRKGVNSTFATPVKGRSNDDAERIKRRSIADIQRRLSSIPASPNVSDSPRVPDKECKEHITSVLKMFAENKINYKNVWNLKFIDYMRTMLRNQGFGRDSLQMATTSLDAGAKVYSVRVDDLHSDGMKLASNMARYDQQNEKNQDEEKDDSGPEVEEGREKAKKAKKTRIRFKKGVKNTIAKDIKTVIGDYPKLESAYYQTKNDLDSFGSTSLFTLNMTTDYFGNMIFPNSEKPFSYEDPNKPIDPLKKAPFEISEMQVQICPQFIGFQVNEWDPDKEDELIHEKDKSVTHEVVYDEHGIPIPELVGSPNDVLADAASDPFAEHSADEEDNAENAHSNNFILDDSVSHLSNFRTHMTMGLEDDYSYHSNSHLSDKFTNRVWAGPSHWKLKHIRRAKSKFSGLLVQQEQKKVNKRAKTVVPLNFLDAFSVDMTMPYKKRKVILNIDSEKITLPQIYLDESTTGLMSRDLDIDRANTNSLGQRDYVAEPYNYENPNDAEYCSQIFADDNANDSECGSQNPGDEEEFVQRQGPLTGDNLVDAPELVPKHNMRYATKAKKMDMKKLKNVIWKCVVSDKTLPYEAVNDEDMPTMPAKPHTFSEIMRQLPSKLKENMREELSTPLAFVAILHLANEHNLKFTNAEDLTDFYIVQDKIRGG